MTAVPMNVLMLGADYQYPFAPLGNEYGETTVPYSEFEKAIESGTWPWPGWSAKSSSTGGVAMDTTGTRVVLTKPSGTKIDVGNILDKGINIISSLFGKPQPAAVAVPAKTDYTPYLLIGGAAVVAFFMMSGTRRRS